MIAGEPAVVAVYKARRAKYGKGKGKRPREILGLPDVFQAVQDASAFAHRPSGKPGDLFGTGRRRHDEFQIVQGGSHGVRQIVLPFPCPAAVFGADDVAERLRGIVHVVGPARDPSMVLRRPKGAGVGDNDFRDGGDTDRALLPGGTAVRSGDVAPVVSHGPGDPFVQNEDLGDFFQGERIGDAVGGIVAHRVEQSPGLSCVLGFADDSDLAGFRGTAVVRFVGEHQGSRDPADFFVQKLHALPVNRPRVGGYEIGRGEGDRADGFPGGAAVSGGQHGCAVADREPGQVVHEIHAVEIAGGSALLKDPAACFRDGGEGKNGDKGQQDGEDRRSRFSTHCNPPAFRVNSLFLFAYFQAAWLPDC